VGQRTSNFVTPEFDVGEFLRGRRERVLGGATSEVEARRLPHYEAAGAEELEARLAALFDIVVRSAAERRLDAAVDHANAIAVNRQESGHDLSEVQRAINSLEEQLWHAVLDEAAPEVQGYALGVVSTILGAIKDRVACEYVSRAPSVPTHTLRVEELFRGTGGGTV
jgi:hypothetical protein